MSKREDELLRFMSDDERESYETHQKKAKAARDKAVKRRKVELDFWRQVRERRDEVRQYLVRLQAEEQAARQPEQIPQSIQQPQANRAAEIKQAMLENQQR